MPSGDAIEILKARNLIVPRHRLSGLWRGHGGKAPAIRAIASAGLRSGQQLVLKSSSCAASALAACPWCVKTPKPRDAYSVAESDGPPYLSPPNFGAQVVATVLGDETLKASGLRKWRRCVAHPVDASGAG